MNPCKMVEYYVNVYLSMYLHFFKQEWYTLGTLWAILRPCSPGFSHLLANVRVLLTICLLLCLYTEAADAKIKVFSESASKKCILYIILDRTSNPFGKIG